MYEICILLSSRLFSEAFHLRGSAKAHPPEKGRSGSVCFSKLRVAFYGLIDGAGGVQNT